MPALGLVCAKPVYSTHNACLGAGACEAITQPIQWRPVSALFMQLIHHLLSYAGSYAADLIDEAKQFDTMRHVFAGAGACGGMCTAHTMPVNMDTVHAANHHLLSCAGSFAADLDR